MFIYIIYIYIIYICLYIYIYIYCLDRERILEFSEMGVCLQNGGGVLTPL